MSTRTSCAGFACYVFLLFSCKHDQRSLPPAPPEPRSQALLLSATSRLDALLRSALFTPDSLTPVVAAVEHQLSHATRRHKRYDAWSTTVDYRWSNDSTVTLIRAYKTYPKGFSREVFVHFGDSLLFLHRFSTHPLALESADYTFLESIYYLETTGTVRHLGRIAYDQKDLSDTLAFRKVPLRDLTDEISHYYSMELSYARNIFQ